MSEKKDVKTGTEEKTGTEKVEQKKVREADQIIEIRNVYSTDVKTNTEKKVIIPTDTTVKNSTTKKKPEEKKEVPENKDIKDVPKLSVEELETQLAAEKKKRGELELIVEAEATKQFETDKTEFLTLIPDEEERAKLSEKIGDNPEVLNEYKRISSFFAIQLKNAGVKVTGVPKDDTKPEDDVKLDDDTKSKDDTKPEDDVKLDDDTKIDDDKDDDKPADVAPAGKVGLKTPNQGVNAENYKEYVDALYDIINNPEKSLKERKAADAEAGKLFAEMLLGIKGSEATKKGNMPHLPAVGTCPNCGVQLTGDLENCSACGWKHYSQNFTPRR